MTNRVIGILIILMWGVAIVALLQRDVIPYWRADLRPPDAVPIEHIQVGIFINGRWPAGGDDAVRRDPAAGGDDPSGRPILTERRIGTSWVFSRSAGELSMVQSSTVLHPDKLPLPALNRLPSVLFDTSLVYQRDATLQEFETQVLGLPMPVRVEGVLLGIDYSCLARFGKVHRKFSLDARMSRHLGEALRPFSHLPNLEVGRTWQVRLLDPVSLLRGSSADFRPMLVRVSQIDTIPHPHDGRDVDCFRVESDRAWAWVDKSGRVLVQVVDVPLLGKLTIRDEPYRDALRRETIQRFKSRLPKDESQPAARTGRRRSTQSSRINCPRTALRPIAGFRSPT